MKRLIAILCLFCGVFAAQGSSQTFSNTSSTNASSNVSSLSLAYSLNNTPGNALIAWAVVRSARSGETNSIHDTSGNSYLSCSQQDVYVSGSYAVLDLWFVQSAKGGANTVTVTPSSSNPIMMGITELSGFTNMACDQATHQGGSSTWSSLSAGPTSTLASSSELVLSLAGVYAGGTSAFTAGSSFTLLSEADAAGTYHGSAGSEYKWTTTNSGVTATMTAGTSYYYQFAVWTFTGMHPQTVNVTTAAPPSAVYNQQFTVAATATSGLAVTYGSSGGCSNSGATYTMTSGTTPCTVTFNQSGNSNYAPASQITETVTATKATPSVSLSCSPNPLTLGANTTCAATVPATDGTVTFYSPTTLTGEWWNGTSNSWYPAGGGNLTGAPFATTHDGTLNYNITNTGESAMWSGATYAPAGADMTYLYARWTGSFVSTIGGTYTIGLNSDDGANVYVNGTALVSNLGTGQGSNPNLTYTQSGTINLTAGATNTIVVEYQQGTGDAGIQLLWTPPGASSPSLLGWSVVPVNSSGQASITGAVTVASAISAMYSGDANYTSASASTNVTFTPAGSVTQISSSLNPLLYGNAVTFNSLVNTGGAIPTGILTFEDGGSPIGTGTVSAASTTNLLQYSQQLTASTWGAYCSGSGWSNVTPYTTELFAPDGTQTATKFLMPGSLSCGAGGAFGALTTVPGGLTAGQSYTVSVWLRGAVGGEWINLNLNDCMGQGVTLTNSWQRYTVTFPSVSASIVSCATGTRGFQFTGGTAGSTFYAWGAQLEQASSVGPYVATTASPTAGSGGTASFNTASLTAGVHSITATYSGNSSIAGSMSPSLTQTVTTIAPTVNWPTPAPIIYGAPLSATQLNASASVPGTFVYTPAAGTALGAGTYTLQVTFTPNDTTDYNSVTTSVQLTVNQAQLMVTANNVSRPYNTANPIFTASYAGFVNGDSSAVLTGTPSFTTTATVTSPVGSYPITATAGTLSAANYSFSDVNGTLTVNQAVLTSSVISTVAGIGNAGCSYLACYSGDGGPATSAQIMPTGVAVDVAGNFYIADGNNSRVRKVASNGIITTVAGNGSTTYSGDNGPATSAGVPSPWAVALDAAGNIYISDGSNRIRKVLASTGVITTVAGNGAEGYSGDGGPATSAALNPSGVAVDSTGNIYIAELVNNRIRMVAASNGVITTVAGNGTYGFSGDGGAATGAQLWDPAGVAVDSAGNIYIADGMNGRIRKVTAANGFITTVASGLDEPFVVAVDSAGNVYTTADAEVVEIAASTGGMTPVAGNGMNGFYGDDGPATSAEISVPFGLAVNAGGDIYIADFANYRVREVQTAISWTTPAPVTFGTPLSSAQLNATAGGVPGTFVYTPPAGTVLGVGTHTLSATFTPSDTIDYSTPPALSVTLTVIDPATPTVSWPSPAAITYGTPLSATQLNASASIPGTFTYVPSLGKVLGAGSQTLAVTFTPNDTNDYDSVTATVELTVNPAQLTVTANNVSRPYNTSNPIFTNLPNGGASYSGFVNGETSAVLVGYPFLTTTAATTSPVGTYPITAVAGILTAANYSFSFLPGTLTVTQAMPTSTSIINTVAGNGTDGYAGDGGLATQAEISYANSVTVDASGNIYIADTNNHCVRKVTYATGVISTVAGNGIGGYSGDGGPATSAELYYPEGVAVDASGNIYIADTQNSRIRMVAAATGVISTMAGNGTGGYSGDGGPATNAQIQYPLGVAVDSSGNIYIADGFATIRKVTPAGLISTVAGTGFTPGYNGDNQTATSAQLNYPSGVAVDATGNIYIADTENNRIRKVTFPSGLISTVAGNGTAGPLGDGEPAVSAELNLPMGVAVDSLGNIYIADWFNSRIREVIASTGMMTTAAGNWTAGYSGDGGPATGAMLSALGVAASSSGNLYIADTMNNRVREVGSGTNWATPAPITYGTPLSSAQLNATSDVAGTFVYTPPAGAVLGVGTYTLSAAFTPADPTDYATPRVQTVTLNVNQATPTILWNPVPIAFGTPLGTSQLDATANVPGTFVYSAGLGTVLPSGPQTLSVTFTPIDTTDYNSATVSVTIEVGVSILGLSPSSGPVGTLLTITGIDFGTSPGTVAIGGLTASVVSWKSSSIIAWVPNGASVFTNELIPIVVSAGGQSSNAVGFTVTGSSTTNQSCQLTQ